MFVPVPHVGLTFTGPQQASREELAHLGAAMDKLERLLNASSYYSNSLRAQVPPATTHAAASLLAASPALACALARCLTGAGMCSSLCSAGAGGAAQAGGSGSG